MGAKSSIDWTESTWNPLTGCDKVSPGCKHCYAERLAGRLRLMGQPNYQNGFNLTLHPHALELPLTWKRPHTIFVNSMSDLFHRDVPVEFIEQVFSVMARADWHRYQLLTKRSQRLRELSPGLTWPPHVWMGVSVENDDYASRIRDLAATGAATKFLSLEPLLGPLDDLDLTNIDWVIVGGESGPGARPMDLAWARSIRDQCRAAQVPFFLKQLGGRGHKRAGDDAVLDGRLWREMPEGGPLEWRRDLTPSPPLA